MRRDFPWTLPEGVIKMVGVGNANSGRGRGRGGVNGAAERLELPLFLLHRSASSYCPSEIRTGYYPPGFPWQIGFINLLCLHSRSFALERREITSRCFMRQKAGNSLGAVIVIDILLLKSDQAEAELKMQPSVPTFVIFFPWFQGQKIRAVVIFINLQWSALFLPPHRPCAHVLHCVVLVCKRHIFCQCQLGSSLSRSLQAVA